MKVSRPDGPLWNVSAIARLIGVSPETVRSWIRTGKIPAIHTPGGHYRLTAAVCQQLVTEQNKVADHADDAGDPLAMSSLL